MTTLRLFLQSEPFNQLEERQLDSGELVVGRGEDADWRLTDPTHRLSRRHCAITVDGGAVSLRDLSVNGVFLGPTRERAPSDAPVNLPAGETVRLGGYMIFIDIDSRDQPLEAERGGERPGLRTVGAAIDGRSTGEPVSFAPRAVPETTRPASPGEEAAALDAFCEGAHLDASAFADEDPAAVMRRLGAVYRQMVLGLTDLMDERTTVKADYQMDRTAIRPAGNNPFRWASANRLAIDLLREREDGFLSGQGAVEAAFSDVKKHLLCVFAGARAALSAVLEALSPKSIEAKTPARATLMKGRGSAVWAQYVIEHAAYQQDAGDPSDGFAGRAFRSAYGRRLEELDAGEAP
jgi:predicted component of type VI protein secretion system